MLKQSSHQSTLRSPFACFAVRRLQDLIVTCTLRLLHFFIQQHELVELVGIDRGFLLTFKHIRLQIESRKFIIFCTCGRQLLQSLLNNRSHQAISFGRSQNLILRVLKVINILFGRLPDPHIPMSEKGYQRFHILQGILFGEKTELQ